MADESGAEARAAEVVVDETGVEAAEVVADETGAGAAAIAATNIHPFTCTFLLSDFTHHTQNVMLQGRLIEWPELMVEP